MADQLAVSVFTFQSQFLAYVDLDCQLAGTAGDGNLFLISSVCGPGNGMSEGESLTRNEAESRRRAVYDSKVIVVFFLKSRGFKSLAMTAMTGRICFCLMTSVAVRSGDRINPSWVQDMSFPLMQGGGSTQHMAQYPR